MIPAIRVKADKMRLAAAGGYSTATDLADYLVRKGVPFRDAHEIVGAAVRLGIDSHRELSELSLAELEALSDKIEKDVFQVLTPEGSVSSRDHFGGTAPRQVTAALQRARKRLLK
jgi:argininosuccinate lyase